MPSKSWEFGMDIVELKEQRCARRSASFSKEKAKEKKREGASFCTHRTHSVGPVGSDFAHPHRMARTARKTYAVKDQTESSSDMPQISVERAGAWTRGIEKQCISTTLDFPKCQQESVREANLSEEEQQKILLEVEEERLAMLDAIRSHWAVTAHKDTAEEMGSSNELPELLVARTWDDNGTSSAPLAVPDTFANTFAPFEENFAEASQQTLPIEKTSELLSPARAEASSSQTNDGTVNDLTPRQGASPNEMAKEELLDWVVVSSDNGDEPLLTATEEIHDTQLPGHMAAKQCAVKGTKPKSEAWDLDWSQEGIPREVTRQLIHGSMNPSHRSIHANKPTASPSVKALRQQASGSSRRQLSAPRTPRSQSKPRFIQQPAKKR